MLKGRIKKSLVSLPSDYHHHSPFLSHNVSISNNDSVCILKVVDIKEDLNSLGPKMEEFRSVCRQLQSQLKKIPDCSETPFEMEADALVDSWLDVRIWKTLFTSTMCCSVILVSWQICVSLWQVSEKTDCYMDNLRVGLELWEKQLVLGGEVESWTSTKLIIFSESHPFSSETEVDIMKVCLQKNC